MLRLSESMLRQGCARFNVVRAGYKRSAFRYRSGSEGGTSCCRLRQASTSTRLVTSTIGCQEENLVVTVMAFLAGRDSPTAYKGDRMEVEQGSIQGNVFLNPDMPGTVAGTVMQLFCSPETASSGLSGRTGSWVKTVRLHSTGSAAGRTILASGRTTMPAG